MIISIIRARIIEQAHAEKVDTEFIFLMTQHNNYHIRKYKPKPFKISLEENVSVKLNDPEYLNIYFTYKFKSNN